MSSVTGAGFEDFFGAVSSAREEFVNEVRPEVESMATERRDKQEREKQDSLKRLMRDMKLGGGAKKGEGRKKGKGAQGDDEEEEEDEKAEEWEEEYEGDGQIVDPVSGTIFVGCRGSKLNEVVPAQDTDEERPEYDEMFGSSTAGRTYGADGTVWPKPA